MTYRQHLSTLFIFLFCFLSNGTYTYADNKTKYQPLVFPLDIIKTINHDTNTYTQGLFYDGAVRFESSGLYGKSFIRRFDKNGEKTQKIAPHYFAEGLTIIANTLYLLTWKSETLLLFDKNTLKPKGSIVYQGQGWGLTHNNEHFIMSNGSNRLTFRNEQSFKIEKTVIVPDIDKLNELEYIDGIIWANRWYDDTIYAISEGTGCIIGTLDLSSLREQAAKGKRDNVANGIAYYASMNALLITGKRWARQYFVALPQIASEALEASCH